MACNLLHRSIISPARREDEPKMRRICMLSKKIAIYIAFFLLLSNSSVSAGFGKELIITQQTYQSAGVLVCRPSPLDETIRDLIVNNNIYSLGDYIHWLGDNVEYKKDLIGDDWATPAETLARKNGDCEDFAFLNAAFLRVGGYQPQVIAIIKILRPGHAICVFKENNCYSWIDNNELRRTEAQSMRQLAKVILEEYDYSYLKELELESKTKVTLFKRSELSTP